jgi:cytochrome c553
MLLRLILVIWLALVARAAFAAEPGTVEFFEAKIRPVLIEKCYSCHSADAAKKNKLRGGLALDTKAGLLAGGDSGAVLAPGKPGESLLLKSLKYTDELKMPPAGKLPDNVIKDFEAWIQAGANDPRAGETGIKKQIGPSIEEGKKHWAYQPLRPFNAKKTVDDLWRAKLLAEKLTPAPEATAAVWLRRVTFDLSGLPPTVEELQAFEVASARNAVAAREAVVDRLLAAPSFGERWGRHWLDVVRYADSVSLRGTIFPDAWRYRDYVIDNFNRDRPFARFIQEQIAGDLLPAEEVADQAQQRIATTFLMLGNTNLEEQDKKQLRMDVVDEQLDVITKGFLAQTVTCARCHDHKFDPIPTRDYYALAGILRSVKSLEDANVSNWVSVPLAVSEIEDAKYVSAEKTIAAIEAKLKGMQAKQPSAKGALAVKDVPGIVVDDAKAKKVGVWKESTSTGVYIGAGYLHDDNGGKGDKTVTFQPEAIPAGRYEVLLSYSHSPSRAKAVPITVASADGEKTIKVDMQLSPPVDGRYVSLGEHRFEKDGLCYVIVSNEGTVGHVTADAVVFKALDKQEQSTPMVEATKTLEAELKKLKAIVAERPKAMSVLEEAKPTDLKVHIRGSVHTLGEVAPRGFLQVAGGQTKMPAKQSGRRELAAWIASPQNPLTARVYVNRAWHWLFGSGIVRTVDNFGFTGETPSNPELLDHLAGQFVADNWSVKKLVRRIVLSEAYRRSRVVPTMTTDPDNRFFARANRRRLEGEAIRDAMLAMSGQLDRSAGGMPFNRSVASDYNFTSKSLQRTIYLPMFRNSMPEVLSLFDGADPSTVTGKRTTGTIAPQALYLMNHPFPAAQAAATAAKLQTITSADARLDYAYQLTLGRLPTPGEREAVRKHLAKQNDWAGVIHVLFASADFRTLD